MTNPSLKHRMLRLTLLTSVAALLCAGTVFFTYEYFHLHAEFEEDTHALGRLVAGESAPAMAQADRAAAQRLLDALATQEHVVAATLLDPRERVMARYVRRDAETAPVAGQGSGQLGGLVWSRQPVRDGSREVGTLLIATSSAEVLGHLLREMLIGAAVVLPAFALAFLGSLSLQRRILAPLETLLQRASRELNVEAREDGERDEVALLSHTFEQMLTSLRERERGLSETEQYFRALIENSADFVAVIDREGLVRYNGPSCERIFDVDPGAFIGRPFIEHVHMDDRERVWSAIASVLDDPGSTFSVTARFVARGGHQLELECVGRNELGTPAVAGVILNCRDITERRASERAMRDSERRYREVVEHAADAFFVHDERGHLLDVNQRACESLGYTREELLCKSVPDFELNVVKLGARGIWSTLRAGEPVTLQGCHRRKDGSTFPVEVRVGAFQTGQHGERRFVALARDVSARVSTESELKRARDAAETADRAKSLFLANVSHEIRTPLTSILGMSELLKAGPRGADREHYVDVIRGSCDALMSVIDGILDLSRAEAGNLELEEVEFDVRELAEGVQDMISPSAHHKGVDLVALVEPDVPTRLRGDPDRLRQVLTNLLTNAVKFTDAGHVRLRIAVLDDREDSLVLHVSVRDTGIGVGDSERARLFEPFVRGDGAPTRRQRGAGLGLAISKFLVEKMGGSIGAQPNVDGGSLFWFTARLGKGFAVTRPVFDDPQSRGLRLLVADRGPAVREVVVEHARRWGMVAEATDSADGALRMLREAAAAGRPFDVLLADVSLDGGPGVALAAAVAADPTLEATHTALLTRVGASLDLAVRELLEHWPHVALPIRQSRFGPLVAALCNTQVARPPAGDAREAAVTERPGRRLKVLLAEDDTVSREALTLLLETLGCTVSSAGNGREAVDAVAHETFDLVLMDWRMPVMNGLDATAAIRAMEAASRHTRIVGVTASGSRAEREQCLNAGMDGFLRKPITLQRLREALSEVTPNAGSTAAPARGTAGVAPIPEEARLRLQQLFADHARRSLEQMRSALDANDTSALREHAHSLAGASAQVNASTLSRACRTLERCCAEGDVTDARSLLRRVEMALESVLRESMERPAQTG